MNVPFVVDAPLGMIEPLIIISVVGILLLLVDLILPHGKKHLSAYLALAGVVYALARTAAQWGMSRTGYSGMVVLDNLSTLFNLLFLSSTGVVILLSMPFLRKDDVEHSEYYALLLFATAGMMILASGLDLITLFLGIEVLSISLYILAGYRRDSDASNEAAMKYFLLGAFASSILLYGIALVYGATGTTNLAKIAEAAGGAGGPLPEGLLFAGVALILVGFAFKVAAAPFHMWTPDVYEGAPTPITAFLSAGPKAAAFAAAIRVFFIAFGPIQAEWDSILSVIAALTMTIGNIAAIAQTNVKRMLAYSSIAHAGYLLIALVVGGEIGGQALLFYLLSYTAMALGAFGVLGSLKEGPKDNEAYKDLAGLGFKRPFLGAAMALFMLSLAGFPPLGGFTGKFYLFHAAIVAGHLDLAIIGAINSLLSVVFYLKVIVAMYMEQGGAEGQPFNRAPYLYLAVAACLIGTIYLGIFPSAALDLSLKSFASLR